MRGGRRRVGARDSRQAAGVRGSASAAPVRAALRAGLPRGQSRAGRSSLDRSGSGRAARCPRGPLGWTGPRGARPGVTRRRSAAGAACGGRRVDARSIRRPPRTVKASNYQVRGWDTPPQDLVGPGPGSVDPQRCPHRPDSGRLVDASHPVSRILYPRGGGDHFSGTTLTRGLQRPTRGPLAESTPVPLRGLSPGGVYPASPVTRTAVRSYRTVSPLPDAAEATPGGLFSVALSLASRPVAVSNRPDSWSPDFPPRDPRSRPEPSSRSAQRPPRCLASDPIVARGARPDERGG